MPKAIAPNEVVDQLNRVLKLDGALIFQKVLLDNVLSRHPLALVARRVGVRRETIWRYKTGQVRAPFDVLVKIAGVIDARIVLVTD
jgi:DNA-binding phage protein